MLNNSTMHIISLMLFWWGRLLLFETPLVASPDPPYYTFSIFFPIVRALPCEVIQQFRIWWSKMFSCQYEIGSFHNTYYSLVICFPLALFVVFEHKWIIWEHKYWFFGCYLLNIVRLLYQHMVGAQLGWNKNIPMPFNGYL